MTHQTVATLCAMIVLVSISSVILTGAQTAQPVEITCDQIVNELTPCLSYVRGKEDKPSDSCCAGAKQLSEQATTKPDKVTACDCIKRVLITLPDLNTGRVSGLPKACGITYDLPPIDRNFDCSK